jgi:uncharacterized protein YkwD
MNPVLAAGVLAFILAACMPEQRAGSAGAPGLYGSLARADAAVDAKTAQDMFSAYRANRGLDPLSVDPDLQRIAESEARAMAAADRPNSAEAVKARLSGAGFKAPGANLSAGYHTLAEAFSGWRDSPQHNGVLLDRRASRMGIATAYAAHSKYKVYWVLVTAGDGS